MKSLEQKSLMATIAFLLDANIYNLVGAATIANERDAFVQVNQQGGVIIVNEADGKKFVSFRLSTLLEKKETPEFLAALRSLEDIHN